MANLVYGTCVRPGYFRTRLSPLIIHTPSSYALCWFVYDCIIRIRAINALSRTLLACSSRRENGDVGSIFIINIAQCAPGNLTVEKLERGDVEGEALGGMHRSHALRAIKKMVDNWKADGSWEETLQRRRE